MTGRDVRPTVRQGVTTRAAPVLETARLRLRGFRADDFDAVFAMVSDPAVMKHVSGPQSREEAWRRILTGAGCWQALGYGYFVVERRTDGVLLGQCGLADFHRDMTPGIEGIPELGYIFGGHAHGQGYASEAARAVLDWADATLATSEYAAIIDPDNLASRRVAERVGFTVRELATYRGEPIVLMRRTREAA